MSEPPDGVSWSEDIHAPTDACYPWHCFFHDVDESSSGYRVCGECAHTYSTATALELTYRAYAPAGLGITVEQMTAEEIFFCPLCLHDF